MAQHEAWKSLSAYLDGELAPAERPLIEAHLASCPDCRCELAALRLIKAQTAALPRRAMPSSLADLVAGRLSLEPEQPWWRTALFEPALWVPAGALAAAALWAFLALPGAAEAESLPLDVMMASHARCAAEAIVPNGDLVDAEFSSRLEDRQEQKNGSI